MNEIENKNIKIGTDICQINRYKKVYEKYGERFLRRILTENEYTYVTGNKKNLISRLVGRFAAKEAILKVLGTGVNGVYFKEIEILRENTGAPKVILHKRAERIAKEKKLSYFEISISHEKDYVIAMAIGY